MHKLLPCLILFLIFTRSIFASPDSLLVALKEAKTPIEKVDALNNLSFFEIQINFQKSLNYGYEALDLSKKEGYLSGEASANLNIGWAYWKNSYYQDALPFLHRARNLFHELNDLTNRAKTCRILGLLYLYIVENDSAINYLSLAKDQFEEAQDSVALALLLSELELAYGHAGDIEAANNASVESYKINLTSRSIRFQYHTWITTDLKWQTYQNEHIVKSFIPSVRRKFDEGKKGQLYKLTSASTEMGNLYQMLENFDSAHWYYQFAVVIADSLDEKRMKAHCMMDLALNHLMKGESEKAEDLYELAYEILLAEKDHPNLGWVSDYLGKIALGNNQFDKALLHFKSGVVLSDTLGHLIDVVRFNRRLSDTYRSMGNTRLAIETADRSYQLAVEIGAPKHVMWGAEKLHMAYKDHGDYLKAYEYLTIYNKMALEDERNTLTKENMQFQALFELNEKTKVIDHLNQENTIKQAKIDLQRTYLISAISGGFIVIVFALILQNRMKTIRKLNEKVSIQNSSLKTMNEEKELLLKEIHHRVKNNLQMMSSMMDMQKRRVDENSTKLLFSYTQSRIKSIALIHEHLYKTDALSSVDLRSYLEELVVTILTSFNGKSDPKLNLEIPDTHIDIDTAIPIGLIVNELITNAMKYAFPHSKDPSLCISLREEDDQFHLEVKDNGPGGKIDRTGFGWMIISSMIKNLAGSVEIENDHGLLVIMTFPTQKINSNSSL